MTKLRKIDPSEFVTVQGEFAIINQGKGYAIINIETQKVVAQNLISFVDCIQTIEYFAQKSFSQPSTPTVQEVQVPLIQSRPSRPQVPSFNLRPDIQALIEKYAPNTVRVEKKVHLNRSRYKCYDASGELLGRVQGKLGKRYWEDCDRKRFY